VGTVPRVTKPSLETAPKTPVRRRRTTARPPRRDWAAEAAATPAGVPAPPPSSLATSPSPGAGIDAANGATPVKRRRGTRGGRGRKRSTAASANGASEVAAKVVEMPRPAPTVEGALAQQAAAFDRFAEDVGAAIGGLQSAVAELRAHVGRPATAFPRVGIFVDVPNVIYAAERRGITIDFGRVLEHFTKGRELVRASAYAPITDDPLAKLESQRFAQHFVGHPYRIVTKPLKRFADGSMKANFDIELAVDILTMSERLDVVVLMSGDGDFKRVVELVASRGVRVEVAAFSETASSELKGVADLYVDLGAHLDEFRAAKRP
jgi:uncharacterized LabA/DUF88 family protein